MIADNSNFSNRQNDNRPDTVVIPQRPEWRDAVALIAGNWDCRGQNVYERPLTITRVMSRYGMPSEYIVRIDGTPSRGLVVVSAAGDMDPVVRCSHRVIKFRDRKAMQIRRLVNELVDIAWPKVEVQR